MRAEETSETGGPVASRAGQWSWAFFDWANQPYFTLITTFIFAPYFATGFVGDPVEGQALWGYAQAMAGLAIAVAAPLLGAVADQTGGRKPWIFFFSIIFAAASMLLWFAFPGAPNGTGFIIGAVVAAAVGMELALVFYNAMLPDLVPARRMGMLSGIGWGVGHVGGLVALFLVLGFMVPDAQSGLTLFGTESLFEYEGRQADRFTGPFSALWYMVFVLPFFLLTPDVPPRDIRPRTVMIQGMAQLTTTLKKLPSFKNIGLFLIARMVYNDGLAAVFAFGGIYGAGVFGWQIETLGIFGIVISIFAALGSFLGGWMDQRVGSKTTILISVAGLVLAVLLSASITRDTLFFVFEVAAPDPGGAPFSGTSEQLYLLAGVLMGVFSGPAQAASRTFMARISPPGMMTEFFGIYAFSGKATSFVAPFLIALATTAASSQRAGLFVVMSFLALGFLLLLPVREERAEV